MVCINRMQYRIQPGRLGNVIPAKAAKVFLALSNPFDGVLSDNSISAIESFFCLMYDKTTYISNVTNSRQMLFMKKSKTVDNIPPTKNALIQNVKWAVYHAG